MSATFVATGGYRLRLVGVRPIGSTANRATSSRLRGRAFVALFDLAGGQGMAGDLIYRMARGQDQFDIYLGAIEAARRMQAVFG